MRVFVSCLASAVAATALIGQEQSSQNSAAPPQYFDEPKFVVAGVTDPSQRCVNAPDQLLCAAKRLSKEPAPLRTIAQGATSAADAAEKQGNALEAVREYQRVAELDPSEAHLFDWGTEL